MTFPQTLPEDNYNWGSELQPVTEPLTLNRGKPLSYSGTPPMTRDR
jgi:hypothetical protein